MPFSYPATSLFDDQNVERVVWSEQEYDARLAAGWTTERQAPADPAETPAAVDPKVKRKVRG